MKDIMKKIRISGLQLLLWGVFTVIEHYNVQLNDWPIVENEYKHIELFSKGKIALDYFFFAWIN